MKVTIMLPPGWPSREVLNGLEQIEIQAEGSTLEEVLIDAARQNEHLRSPVHVVCVDKTFRNSVYVYLGRTEYRRLPLRLQTPVEEGDIISLQFGG